MGRICFVSGTNQVAPWLEEAVQRAAAGAQIIIRAHGEASHVVHRVHVVRLARKESDVEPIPLPGLSAQTERMMKNAPSRAKKSGRRKSEQGVQEKPPLQNGSGNSVPKDAKEGGGDGKVIGETDLECCKAKAEAARLAGNAILTNPESSFKQIRKALSFYNEALMWNESGRGDGDTGFAVRVLLNIVLAMSKLEDYRTCVLYCDAILELDPACVKAYYRRGQASAKLLMWVRAERDLAHAATLSPDSRDIRQELKACRNEAALFMHRTRKEFAETYGYMPSGPVYKAADAVET